MTDYEHVLTWQGSAERALLNPLIAVICPECRAQSLRACWNVVDLETREAEVDLACGICGAKHSLRLSLPASVPQVFPIERLPRIGGIVEQQMRKLMERVGRLANKSPVAEFTTSALWVEARWESTTFRWHPTSDAPPIMGIVFANAEKGRELFRSATKRIGNSDRFEELRVSVIEGSLPGQQPGYSVHIGPDPDSLSALGTAEDIVIDHTTLLLFGQLNRMYPIPGQPNLLRRFRQEYAKHQEYLLAPVTRRADGQLWVDVELGIVKNTIEFRDLADINEGDVDAAAVALPLLISPHPI